MASIDIDRFSQLVRQKRGGDNLRDIAGEIGDVSISTLSRIEKGKIPDLSTFIKICKWLNVSPNEFAPDFKNESTNHKEKVFYHLRADSSLKPEVADTLKKMIEIAYENSSNLGHNKS